ncbi:MAG: hypothetical protein Q9198_007178 [Flavoplaca austrocitrina]
MKSAEECMTMTRSQENGDSTLSRFPLPPNGTLQLPIRNGSSVGSSQHDSRTEDQASNDSSDGESIADPQPDADAADFTPEAYASIIAHLCRELDKDMSTQDYRRAERTYKNMEKRYIDRETNLGIPYDNRHEQREILAQIYLKQGRFPKAKRVLSQLLLSMPLEAARKWRLYYLLSHAYCGLRLLCKAEKWARASLTGREKLLGKDHPLTQESALLVISILEALDDAAAMGLRELYCPHTIPPPPPKSALRTTSTIQRQRDASGSAQLFPSSSHVPPTQGHGEEPQHQNPSNNHVRWAANVWATDSGINAPTKSGKTQLIEAIHSGDEDWVELILGRAPSVEAPCVDSIRPLMHAVIREEKRMVESLLACGAQVDATTSGGTALHKATDLGNLAIMQSLLNHNADIEAKAPFEYRPPLSNQDRIKALALDQPDPTTPIDDKEIAWTPLLRAASKGDEPAVRLLLDRGASVDARSPTNGTPLLHACESLHVPTVDLLLMRNSDIHAQDNYGWTPLHRALVNRTPKTQDTSLLERLKDHNCDINARCNFKKTPLHLAVEKSDGHAVGFFLRNRGDIEARDAAEQTPLHTAITCRLEPMVRLLLDKGADAMAMNRDGDDAEKAAQHAQRKSPEIIELLGKHKKRLKKENSQQKKSKEKGLESRKGSVGEAVRMGNGRAAAGSPVDDGSPPAKRDKSSRLLGKTDGGMGSTSAVIDTNGTTSSSPPAKRSRVGSLFGKGKAQ